MTTFPNLLNESHSYTPLHILYTIVPLLYIYTVAYHYLDNPIYPTLTTCS